MVDALRHRGPDADGCSDFGFGGLGHARLSIIDLSAAANQPMRSRDGRFEIVYNGELYNFRELRRELERDGLSFRTASDTEVILEMCAARGIDSVGRFNGMFAFALVDHRQRRLYLARDRFGIKPLFYWQSGERLVFGSEIKALLASGMVPRQVDPAGLREFMWFGNPLGEHSLFHGIRRLRPGHVLEFDEAGVRVRQYWAPSMVEPRPDVDLDTAAPRVRELLEQAVRAHLVSDVPVGVFLSGGIDSSAVAVHAARHYSGRIRTYTVGFDYEFVADERERARWLAERLGTEHEELYIEARNLREIVATLVHAHDEPFADAANIPLFLLTRELGGDPKVVLQGDGGDELFAGYRRYRVLSHLAIWSRLGRAATALGGLPWRLGIGRRWLRFLAAIGEPDPVRRMALLLTIETPLHPPERVLSPETRAFVGDRDPFREYALQHQLLEGLDPVQQMLLTDLAVLLPCQFLEKVDRSTMANSTEVRVPFLDKELSEYAIGLPSRLKAGAGASKIVLRQALRGTVPDRVLDGPKSGFGVPYSHWLRNGLADFAQEVLSSEETRDSGLFDQRYLLQLLGEHRSGKKGWGFTLWKALHLALWHSTYIQRNPEPGPA